MAFMKEMFKGMSKIGLKMGDVVNKNKKPYEEMERVGGRFEAVQAVQEQREIEKQMEEQAKLSEIQRADEKERARRKIFSDMRTMRGLRTSGAGSSGRTVLNQSMSNRSLLTGR